MTVAQQVFAQYMLLRPQRVYLSLSKFEDPDLPLPPAKVIPGDSVEWAQVEGQKRKVVWSMWQFVEDGSLIYRFKSAGSSRSLPEDFPELALNVQGRRQDAGQRALMNAGDGRAHNTLHAVPNPSTTGE